MSWIDKLSRKIGENHAKKVIKEEEHKIPGIKQEIDILEELRLELVKKDEELEKTRLEWDRTFDSIIDNIVLINRDGTIHKANNSFYNCVERELGHIEFVGMTWKDFKSIAKMPMDNCVVDKCLETGIHQEKVIDINGKVYHVTANPVHTKTDVGNEIIGVVRVARDITNDEKIKRKLTRRSGIYHAISEMSKTLVTHEDWGKAVNLILGGLGRAIGASKVYVFKNEIRDDRICSIKQHVYHNHILRDCKASDITDCLNYNLLPDWQSKMEHGLPVEGSIIECNLCPHKEECVCKDEVLVCAVPIFVNGDWWGFIGFDYHNGTRVWKDEDAVLLRIAADIIGGNIYHRRRYFDVVNGLEDCEDKLSDDK